jgi:multidrug transporter EmrE-like cation transporter
VIFFKQGIKLIICKNMKEKQVSMDDAMKVWWFITWRTGLTMIVLNILLALAVNVIGLEEALGIMTWIGVVLSVIISIYFFKSAIKCG